MLKWTGEYTCAMCRQTFAFVPEAEDAAVAELQRDFPGVDKQRASILCEDCYEKFMKARRS